MHTYIHFVFYEVQKHLVTHVSMLYKDIQFRAATRPSYTLLTNIVGSMGVAKTKQHFARPLDGPI